MKERREHGTGSLLRIQYTDANGVKQKTRTWYLQYYVNGRRVRESAKTEDRHEAQRRLTAKMAEAGAGRQHLDVKGLKYETVRDAWLVYPRKRGPLKSAYTQTDGKHTASGLLHPDSFFAGWDVVNINETALARYIAERKQAGSKDATIRRSLTVLKAILNFAHQDKRFGLPTVPSFKHLMPNDSKPRRGFTDAGKFTKLLGLLPEKCRPLATFQFRTGCRTGAALKILWDHVSEDCNEIELPGEITKSGEPLTLPLVGDGLKDIAAYLRKQTREPGKKIFAIGREGAKTGGKEAYRYHWNRACDELGLGKFDRKSRRYSGLRPHDLRRSAIRNMMRSGVPRNVAMEISGHKTESVFNRYHITDLTDVRDALVKAGKHDKLGKHATK
jgi:integrase